MLGSPSEADDAVQRPGCASAGPTPGESRTCGWLTTVVARVSLDLLRPAAPAARSPWTTSVPDPAALLPEGDQPEREALLADAVGPALLVVLDTLTPAERLAFVLHDLFGVPFDKIAAIVGRSPPPPGSWPAEPGAGYRRRFDFGADRARQRRVVDAFLAAARDGDFDAFVAVLDPDVVLRADPAAVQVGADAEVRGAAAVAGTFAGRARVARPALVEGVLGAVWAPGGRPRVAFAFSFAGGRIAAIDLVADPDRLRQVELAEASATEGQGRGQGVEVGVPLVVAVRPGGRRCGWCRSPRAGAARARRGSWRTPLRARAPGWAPGDREVGQPEQEVDRVPTRQAGSPR